jgi:protein TonB
MHMRLRHPTALLLVIGMLATNLAAQSETVYTPGEGVILPVLVRSVRPNYTSEAMKQRIEGTVTLDTVVRADGSVGDVSVAQSLDSVYGLDHEAVKAVKQFEFKPGMKDGKPVAVRVQIAVRFSLK